MSTQSLLADSEMEDGKEGRKKKEERRKKKEKEKGGRIIPIRSFFFFFFCNTSKDGDKQHKGQERKQERKTRRKGGGSQNSAQKALPFQTPTFVIPIVLGNHFGPFLPVGDRCPSSGFRSGVCRRKTGCPSEFLSNLQVPEGD